MQLDILYYFLKSREKLIINIIFLQIRNDDSQEPFFVLYIIINI